MATMVCERCGAPIQGPPRCLTCGGAPVAYATTESPTPGQQPRSSETLVVAGELPSTATAAPASATPVAEARDPRLVAAIGKIDQLQAAVVQAEENVRQASRQLAENLGALSHDVGAHSRESQAALQRTTEHWTKQAIEYAATFDRSEKVRATQVANTVASSASAVRDLGRDMRSHRPAEPSSVLQPKDLCSPLNVCDQAAIGTLAVPKAKQIDRSLSGLPALVALINAGHLVVEASREDAELEALLTSLVAQAYLSAPPGQLVVTVFNPRLNSTLSGFQSAGAAESKALVNLHPSAEALEKSLHEHLGHMVSVDSSIAGQYSDMGALVQATGQHEHQYRLLVILDAPNQWSDRSCNDMERILQQGASRGISVIFHRDPTERALRDLDFDRLLAGQPTMRAARPAHWTLRAPYARDQVAVTPAPAVPLQAQQRLMGLVTEAAKKGALPEVPFADLLDHKQHSSADGIRITLGRKGTQTTAFTLGDTVSNLHNVLVGGRVGSGKTNLLMVMIYSLAARYTPAELQLFLLDFKEGVEFQQFLGHGDVPALPQAAVVSIESDVQFGLATFRHFTDELARRSQLFKEVGVANVAKYRATTGEVLPRWVLVADEFQCLFEGDTNEIATELLETIVRKGRAFGLHVILASQTLSGIRFSGGKDDAIFAQFPARVVLELDRAESQIFLGSGNDAAAHLRYRGQAILNTKSGLVDDNQQFVVAYAEPALDGLQARIGGANLAASPRVYRGRETVAGGTLVASARRPVLEHGALPVWYGQECTVSAEVASTRLGRTTGSNLIVLGNDTGAAVATLQVAALSAVVAAEPGMQVLVYETLLPLHRSTANMDRWANTVRVLGAKVRVFGDGEADDMLDVLEEAADTGEPTLGLIFGAENSDFLGPADDHDWATTIREHPRKGVHILGQWADIRSVPGSSLDMKSDYETMLFAQASLSVVEDAAGLQRWQILPNTPGRVLVYSALHAQAGMRMVAAVAPLTDADLAEWRRYA